MIAVREFTDARELVAHYRAVNARMAAAGVGFQERMAAETERRKAAEERRKLEDFVARQAKEFRTARHLIEIVADRWGMSMETLLSRSTQHIIVEARREAIKAVREHFPDKSHQWIGRVFGRHWATIINALYGKLSR